MSVCTPIRWGGDPECMILSLNAEMSSRGAEWMGQTCADGRRGIHRIETRTSWRVHRLKWGRSFYESLISRGGHD